MTSGQTAVEVAERWARVEGVRMRYLCAGSGPALVLLHGLLGYSFSWRFNIPALARHRTVIAVDMPGAGFSERSSALECSFRASANRLLSFLDCIGVGPFEFAGTSHGGAVAMMAAAIANQKEKRLQSLVLVAPVNPWSDHGQRLSRLLSQPVVSALLRGLGPRVAAAHGILLRRLYGDPSRIAQGTLEGYSKPYRAPGGLDYALRILSTWNTDMRELESTLPKIAKIPALLMWGSLDKAVDPASAEILRRKFHHSMVKIFDGVGHLPYEEVPEEFNRALVDFLNR